LDGAAAGKNSNSANCGFKFFPFQVPGSMLFIKIGVCSSFPDVLTCCTQFIGEGGITHSIQG